MECVAVKLIGVRDLENNGLIGSQRLMALGDRFELYIIHIAAHGIYEEPAPVIHKAKASKKKRMPEVRAFHASLDAGAARPAADPRLAESASCAGRTEA